MNRNRIGARDQDLLIALRRLLAGLQMDAKGAEYLLAVGFRTLATAEQCQHGRQSRHQQQIRIESLSANDHSASNKRNMLGL